MIEIVGRIDSQMEHLTGTRSEMDMSERITAEYEFTIDWNWFAVDQSGRVGHFTSAGMRQLPSSVRENKADAESLQQHFFERAPEVGSWNLRKEAEVDCGGWKRQGLERYVRDFALMARKGLYSYDTSPLRAGDGRYFLVALPERHILITDLPLEVRQIVSRTQADLNFTDCPYIDSATTYSW